MKRLTTQFDDTRLRATVATPTCSSCCCCCCCLATMVGTTISEVVGVVHTKRKYSLSTPRAVLAIILTLALFPILIGISLLVYNIIEGVTLFSLIDKTLPFGNILFPVLGCLLLYLGMGLVTYKLVFGKVLDLKRTILRFIVIAIFFVAEGAFGLYVLFNNSNLGILGGSGVVTYLVGAAIALPVIIILINRIPQRINETTASLVYGNEEAKRPIPVALVTPQATTKPVVANPENPTGLYAAAPKPPSDTPNEPIST